MSEHFLSLTDLDIVYNVMSEISTHLRTYTLSTMLCQNLSNVSSRLFIKIGEPRMLCAAKLQTF